ncbi:MAG: ThiF family adenylyltransferase, partial [Acidobacteriota bacterium]
RQAFIEVGCRRDSDSFDILLRDRIASADELAARKGTFIAAGLAPNPLPGATSEGYDTQSRPLIIGELYFGEGARRSSPLGFVKVSGRVEMIHSLEIIGPGMHRLALAGGDEEASRSGSYYRRSRWSRTIGALGREAWERLINLRACVVGCGRAGSLIAEMLAHLGFREITLIDGDMIEVHNLGEMAVVADADVGAKKSEALARRLRERMPDALALREISAPLGDDSAIEAAKRCDVLFAAVDDDAARLTAAVTAALYHKTLIDVGASVSYSSSGEAVERFMGADIRLIVPGDGCLLCRGNLVNYRRAVDDLTGYGLSSRRAWRDQRAGSLRSLNSVAASIAVRMLEDLVAERIEGSLWAQLEFSERGRMSISYPDAGAGSGSCSLCAKSGLGDDALAGLKP